MSIDAVDGILMVLGAPRRPRRGLPIGSQVAAGGATICAAWQEECLKRLQPAVVVQEMLTMVFIRRWLDDVWAMFSSRVSTSTKRFLQTLLSLKFYGADLRLKRVRDGEPFGFAIYLEGGTLTIRARMGFVQEARNNPGEGWPSDRSPYAGGPQYRSTRVEKAVAVGHVVRHLDMCTQAEEPMTASLVRTMVELQKSGMSSKTLRSAVSRVAYGGNPGLRRILPVVNWTRTAGEVFAHMFDREDACRRAAALELLWSTELAEVFTL